MSKNSQGSDKKRSVAAITQRSIFPPAKPAIPPINPASTLESNAAAGANRRETRVP
jgi:hypothetical protein